ncbi:MAG: sulfurtransferase [Deltaproteobacteria bacterium]|nr:sulfurtransferase [Deltaproteobacteria bacterium]
MTKNQMISTPLIDPRTLGRVLDEVAVMDARTGADAGAVFDAGHLRGAIRVDLEADLSAPGDPAAGGRHPLPGFDVWLERLGDWGITESTPVVIYDAASGGMAAARAWWMLRAVGHDLVAVVDGGWSALVAAGVPIDTEPSSVDAVGPYPSSRSSWPKVDADFVDRIRRDPRWCLVDARAPERYRGHAEPLDPIAGHIPGAKNLFWRSLLGPDGGFMSPRELMRRWDAIRGDVPSDHVICYCGSGVTACHLLLGMEACGLRGAQPYIGSWSEWCRLQPPSSESK